MPVSFIDTIQSSDLPTTKIMVNGDELPRNYHVVNIVVTKEVNRIPTATIILRDGDPATRDFELSNQALFVPGNEIVIQAGYHSQEEVIFKGLVIKHRLKVRPAQSYLIVECKDQAVKMTIGRKSRYFHEIKDSDIAEEIISQYGFNKEIEHTTVNHPQAVQYDVSDWDFLVTRIQGNGRICVVDDGKLFIKKPNVEQEPVETVTYGTTLLELDAEIDARAQFKTITSYGWDSSEQALLESEADLSTHVLNGNFSKDELANTIGLDNLQLKNGRGENSSLREWVNANALFSQFAKVRGRATFQGIPTVKPDRVLKLEGVGERFNGNAYISGCRHEITEGNWTVDAQLGINPKWFTETFDVNPIPASGITSAVNGLQVGIVTQLADDPDGENRIRVKLPMVDPQGEGTWARVATLDAGVSRGSFFYPEIGDEVIVGFLNDSPDEPIILGMLNSSAKPAPLTATDDNHEKGFVTRSSMKLIFNDDEVSVTIETPNGNRVILSDADGGIKLEDENGNLIRMDSNGIALESASKLIAKASSDLQVESGSSMGLKGGSQLKAEGSAGVELTSTAVTTIKGSIVKIN